MEETRETSMQSGENERVRQKAYELWEKEGRPEGKHEDHWHRAAREHDVADTTAPNGSLTPDPDTSDIADADTPVPTPAAAGDKPAKKPKASGKSETAKKPGKKKS
ncbi:MAG: hypothetical protein JWL93_2371 [Hyphomicrobiales bacterium]|nr:hypothetical protein [Hyphomicrobiales bacterium]